MQTKHRHVVSNFLFDPAQAHASIALFRRSNAVRTYPGKLAPISGTIETGERPLHTAIREIEEETGLAVDDDLELYLSGKPYFLSDASIGRSWTIHPFSWKIKQDSRDIQLDWEHTSWQWTNPKDILEGQLESDSVPNLAESLKRVWLRDGSLLEQWQTRENRAEDVLEQSLVSLKHDHVSGAGWMAGLAVQHFQSIVAAFTPHPEKQQYWFQLRMIAWHLINNGRPSMNAAIEKALLSVLKRIQPCADQAQIISKIQACLAERTRTNTRISESFVSYISQHFQKRLFHASKTHRAKISILTLSASITKSAILALLRAVPEVEVDLRILESRPLCEGAQMASKLLQSVNQMEEDRLQVTIATDASAAILARDVDLVLLGADRISADGDVSNKTGSFAAALCAHAVGKKSSDAVTPKVVILSGTDKIAKPGKLDDHIEEENSSWQVWRVYDIAAGREMESLLKKQKVIFKNVFFEWVPAEYINLYLTEHGAMDTAQIQDESLKIQTLENEIFESF